MKNAFSRLFMASCLSAVLFMAAPVQAADSPAAAASTITAVATDSIKAEMEKSSSSGIPPSVMGTTPGQGGVPLLPGQKPEPVVKMTYDKSKMEGPFYGAQMPKRLFNNVPSEWTHTPCYCERDNH